MLPFRFIPCPLFQSRQAAPLGALAGLSLLCALHANAVPVVLSTDIGNEIDDQWAIAYLLTQPAFDVRGILSAHAPSLPPPSAHTTFRLLQDEVERRLSLAVHPPLYEGSSLPLTDKGKAQPSAAADFLLQESRSFTSQNRLHVIVIGAATDVASALIRDPALADRIQIVAMAFTNFNAKGGHEFNVENDVKAWQVLLESTAPIVVGPGDVCREFLAVNLERCRQLVYDRGPVGSWLWQEFNAWYFRYVKPLRVDDFSKSWFIWDIITLAYERGFTTQQVIPRPRLTDDLALQTGPANRRVEVISRVDSQRLWADFTAALDQFQRTHAPSVHSILQEPL